MLIKLAGASFFSSLLVVIALAIHRYQSLKRLLRTVLQSSSSSRVRTAHQESLVVLQKIGQQQSLVAVRAAHPTE